MSCDRNRRVDAVWFYSLHGGSNERNQGYGRVSEHELQRPEVISALARRQCYCSSTRDLCSDCSSFRLFRTERGLCNRCKLRGDCARRSTVSVPTSRRRSFRRSGDGLAGRPAHYPVCKVEGAFNPGLCPVQGPRAKIRRAHTQSMISCAIARRPDGILTPSALAAFRLMTNSTLVDSSTGRTLGSSPLRMRATQTPTRRYASVRSVP